MDRYGEPPLPAQNLVAVARFRVGAREAGLSDVALQGNFIKFSPASCPSPRSMRLNRMYPGAQSKPALDAVLIPKPKTARIGGRDLQDAEILEWANGVIRNIFSDAPAAPAGISGMMGGHHAASGAAAWVAVASTGPYTLGWYPLDATGILIGGMATAGTALVCDWDHRSQHHRELPAAAVQRDCAWVSRTPAAGTGRARTRCWARRSSLCCWPWPGQFQLQTDWGLLSVGAGLLCMFMINIAAKALKLFPKSGLHQQLDLRPDHGRPGDLVRAGAVDLAAGVHADRRGGPHRG